jgi:hypothetical protein
MIMIDLSGAFYVAAIAGGAIAASWKLTQGIGPLVARTARWLDGGGMQTNPNRILINRNPRTP